MFANSLQQRRKMTDHSPSPDSVLSTKQRLRILEAGLDLIREHGFEAMDLQQVADGTALPLDIIITAFPLKECFALAQYARLAEILESRISEIPEGTLAERFRSAVEIKLELLKPHRKTLRALFARALDPEHRIGVLGPGSAVIRSRVSGLFASLARASSNAPSARDVRRWTRLLYGAHLALILLWMVDGSDQQKTTNKAIEAAESLIKKGRSVLLRPFIGAFLDRFNTVFSELFASVDLADSDERVEILLQRLFRRRRLQNGLPPDTSPSDAVLALHRPRMQAFVKNGEAITLVLPAFPAKAPNLEKVLGKRPDMGESLSLQALQQLCNELAEAHEPGVRLVICSDGHVFADLVGVSDSDVSAYGADIGAMIEQMGLKSLSRFDMRDAFDFTDYADARQQLEQHYAQSPEETRQRCQRSPAQQALFNGIHRFMFEDARVAQPEKSKTQLRKQAKETAYAVTRRSDAWGRLVARCFPKALRLSIHPQAEVSEKIGVHLTPTEDAWLTPWHGVAVLDSSGYKLMKRRQAEQLGAQLISRGGRPSHFEERP
jgi:pyoverdine/dityrosine biosynthesis protein Dit1/AcrR family transcriptional regulator